MVRGLARCLLALLAGSCGILEPPIASMRVEPDHDPIPRNYGDDLFVPMSDLDDPKGLAGIEIRVSWPGSDTLTFTATDLPSPEFEVPNDGSIWVDARLRQNGEIVSEGSANWYLDPGAEWTVFVNRVPAPLHSALTESRDPIRCPALGGGVISFGGSSFERMYATTRWRLCGCWCTAPIPTSARISANVGGSQSR